MESDCSYLLDQLIILDNTFRVIRISSDVSRSVVSIDR